MAERPISAAGHVEFRRPWTTLAEAIAAELKP